MAFFERDKVLASVNSIITTQTSLSLQLLGLRQQLLDGDVNQSPVPAASKPVLKKAGSATATPASGSNQDKAATAPTNKPDDTPTKEQEPVAVASSNLRTKLSQYEKATIVREYAKLHPNQELSSAKAEICAFAAKKGLNFAKNNVGIFLAHVGKEYSGKSWDQIVDAIKALPKRKGGKKKTKKAKKNSSDESGDEDGDKSDSDNEKPKKNMKKRKPEASEKEESPKKKQKTEEPAAAPKKKKPEPKKKEESEDEQESDDDNKNDNEESDSDNGSGEDASSDDDDGEENSGDDKKQEEESEAPERLQFN